MGRLHRARWGHALEQWLDEELDSARADRVIVHLADCPDCVGEVEALAFLKRALARLEPA